MEPWIQTYSGIKFWPFEPNPDDVRFDDIAHALANTSRFGGHTKRFYSVAQHSLLVRELASYDDGLQALLHDATEAYMGDVMAPLKHTPIFHGYRECEKRMHSAIMNHFGLSPEIPCSVLYADGLALQLEAVWHMSPLHTDWPIDIDEKVLRDWREWKTVMSPDEAEEKYHWTFESLWREHVELYPEQAARDI